jgi:hypothetical protein
MNHLVDRHTIEQSVQQRIEKSMKELKRRPVDKLVK